jgi:nitrite reductase/ring-hydroxylating ferredoxin subunit
LLADITAERLEGDAVRTTMIETILEKPRREAARTQYPEGFPVLPLVPAKRYSDPTVYELESEHVFGRSWLFVAHLDQLPNPGDFVRLDGVLGPVLLVRQDDATVRAFYNTCQHRGSALVLEPSGHAGRRLTCPYHGWVYRLDGRLAGYPDAGDFRDLDHACLALRAVRCETWGPFVFVNLDADATPLTEWMRPVSDDLAELGDLAGRLHLVGTRSRDVPVNWKLPVDANIETYHVNVAHRQTAAQFIDQASTGIWLLRNGHSRMLINLRDGVDVSSPLTPLFRSVGRLPESGTFSYHVFPNLSIVFGGLGFLFFITNWPTGPRTSRYDVHFCSSLAPADDQHHLNERIIAATEAVLWEDLAVLPGMQASIDAGALAGLTLSYQERRIYHLHEQIDRAIGAERLDPELRVPAVLGPFVED